MTEIESCIDEVLCKAVEKLGMRCLCLVVCQVETVRWIDNSDAHKMGPHAVCDVSRKLKVGSQNPRILRAQILTLRRLSGEKVAGQIWPPGSQRALPGISCDLRRVVAIGCLADFVLRGSVAGIRR